MSVRTPWRAGLGPAILCLGLAIGLLPLGAGADQLRVLSYNVHGLPAFAAGDNPRDRSPMIGWLASDYDVVALQEDFEFAEHIRRQLPAHEQARGNGVGLDPRRLLPKILISPFALFVPDFWPPYGAGLTSYVRQELALPGATHRERFAACHGWLGAKNDCFSSKGFLRVGVRTEGGAVIHVYNTHLDAGSKPGDVAARREQFVQMFEAMKRESRDVAIILAGDLNTDYARPEDRDVLVEIAENSGFETSGAAGALPHWKDRDLIAFHQGPRTRLRVIESGEDLRFVNDTRTLSDHPALFVRFEVESVAPDPGVQP